MKTNNKLLLAIAAGAVIGGILGLLLAPDKGEITRSRIKSAGKKLADQAEDLFAEARKLSGLTSREGDTESKRTVEQIFE